LVKFLNDILVTDNDAITTLCDFRVPCNEILADHEFVNVLCKSSTDYRVGLLGILSGLSRRFTGKLIAAVYDDKSDKVVKFIVVDEVE